jgi:dUTP pyrophosphatase
MKMKIKLLNDKAVVPTYAHASDAGMDLRSIAKMNIWPGSRFLCPTGIAIEIPEGYFGLMRPRSGLATKYGIDLCTSGVVDSGYRGEIYAGLINHGRDAFRVDVGMRIAQLLILPVEQAQFEIVDDLSDSDRGENGHGSSGA